MKAFSEFGIKQTTKGFVGNKIKIRKILNQQIVVHDYRITNSTAFTAKGNEKCLWLQISIDNTKHVTFTGSVGLIEVIQQIPKEGFPFTTKIVEENDRYNFT